MGLQSEPDRIIEIPCSGEIDVSTYEAFRENIIDAAANGATCVVLDMSAVTFLDLAVQSRGRAQDRSRLRKLEARGRP